jgi:predicted metalloprotease
MRGYFSEVWNDFFLNDSIRLYLPPTLIGYTTRLQTPCGELPLSNAVFCSVNNSIYYDRQFLTNEMRDVGKALGSDGGYAAVLILAHEWGHAASFAYRNRKELKLDIQTFPEEQLADCLAGGVTLLALKDKKIGMREIKEAELEIQRLGTIDVSKLVPENPYRRKTEMDEWRRVLNKLRSHGDPEVRLAAFRTGYQSGRKACFAKYGIRP